MEKDLSDSVVHNSSRIKESETDESFVGKVKSIINNTPLSKWFWRHDDDKRSTVRRRDEVFEDEDICEMQPPLKKAKLPVGNEGNYFNNVLFNETPNTPISNNITKSKFNSFHEPVAGPSGIKSHKLLGSGTNISANSAQNTYNSNELLNGHKDSDSEESTSGYSSVPRIDSKEQVCGSQESSKQTSPLQSSPNNSRSLFHTSNVSTSRSLFADRSVSPNMNSSMSSRRPSFNASTFGSPNFVDKTIATKKIINSPFYNGRTIYGGASAYGRSLGRSSQDLKTSLRSSVQIKPVNKTTESDNLVLGKTARRILDTLEQYSSPINDAKKIPVVSKGLRQHGLLTQYTGANPYIIRDSVPSNKELQVPSVSDLLKMKQRIRLQDSTEMVKQIAASSKSSLNTELYKISTDENEKDKHTGKVKIKVTAPVRKRQLSKETVSEVNLNPVALPITTLPKFDLNIPLSSPTKKVCETVTLPAKKTEFSLPSLHAQTPQKNVETEKNVQIEKQTTTTTIVEYKFSDPLVIAENVKSLVPINNFKFSEPLCKKSKTDFPHNATLNFKMPENKVPTLIPNKIKDNTETSKQTPTLLKTGSVMDILGKKENSLMDKFKPAQGTWECSVCMIRNQPEKIKCVACENPKSVSPKQTPNKDDFGSQYKMSPDKWECSSCMVRNNNSDVKCIACATPKVNANSMSKNTSSSTAGSSSGFGDKFKLSNDSWECSVCMIRNKNELLKCAACETPNPKAPTTSTSVNVDNKFRPPPSTWECTTCLIRNNESVSKCIACEALKPGVKSNSIGFGNAFNVKEDEWECGVCMVRNKMSNSKCQCCESAKPGGNSKPVLETVNDKKSISTFNFGIDKASASAFSFGIPPTAAATPSKEVTNAASIFGNTKPATPVTASFSFGIPNTDSNKPKRTESVTVTTSATPVLQTTNPLLKPNEKLPEKAKASPSGFKFQVPTSTAINNQDKLTDAKQSDAAASVSSSSVNSNPIFNFKPVSVNGDINKTSVFGTKAESTLNTTTFNTPAVTNATIFSFGAKPSAAAAPLNSTAQTQSSQATPVKTLFKFGSSNHLTSEMPSPPSFGSVSSVNSTTTTNGFVASKSATFGGTSTFAAPMTNSSEVKPFTFSTSSATGEPASKASLFSFGSASGPNVKAATAKASMFDFGSTNAPTFNFAGAKTETNFNPPTSNNVFGGTPSTTSKNGTFNFGSMASNNNNQKAGFSFGAAANNASVVPTTQPGFNFGTAALPTQPSGGFSFTGAPPTFNATAKPSFNFTDGSVASFSAQPTTDAAAPRKIKRAVRRTQR